MQMTLFQLRSVSSLKPVLALSRESDDYLKIIIVYICTYSVDTTLEEEHLLSPSKEKAPFLHRGPTKRQRSSGNNES